MLHVGAWRPLPRLKSSPVAADGGRRWSQSRDPPTAPRNRAPQETLQPARAASWSQSRDPPPRPPGTSPPGDPLRPPPPRPPGTLPRRRPSSWPEQPRLLQPKPLLLTVKAGLAPCLGAKQGLQTQPQAFRKGRQGTDKLALPWDSQLPRDAKPSSNQAVYCV